MRISYIYWIICRSFKAGFSLGTPMSNIEWYFVYQHLINCLSPFPRGTWTSLTRGAIGRTEIVSPLAQCNVPQYTNEVKKNTEKIYCYIGNKPTGTYNTNPLNIKNGGKSKGVKEWERESEWTIFYHSGDTKMIPSHQANFQGLALRTFSELEPRFFSSGFMVITREATVITMEATSAAIVSPMSGIGS